ncbi:MAG: phosphoethanolamine transferase [Saprospiraceae bacterium]|nr:phosphoethanolamine transferase [Saprospiraceae bacterium]
MFFNQIHRKAIFFAFLLMAPWLCYGLVLGQWRLDAFTLHCTTGVLLSIPYLLVPNKLFRQIYWGLSTFGVLVWSLAESLYLIKDKVPFNQFALKIFAESFPSELKGYMLNVVPLPASISTLAAISVLLYFVFSVKHDWPILNSKHKKLWLTAGLTSFVIQFFVPIMPQQQWGAFHNTITAVSQIREYYQSITKSPETISKSVESLNLICKGDKKTYVLMVGESTSRHHWELYGYWRDTNPNLSKRDDICLYSDVISSNTSTVESLSKCLTLNANGDKVHDFSDVNIMDIANHCGMTTYWISTHHKYGIVDSSVPKGMSSANHIHYLMDDFPNEAELYDEKLLAYLEKALADPGDQKLIVLQLMGTHIEYKARYPEKFTKFTHKDTLARLYPYADTDQRRTLINDYDNANVYQDYILNQVLNILSCHKEEGNDVSAVYFSDHGEEVYDYRNFLGHTPQSNMSWLHEIPFFTWGINHTCNQDQPYQMNHFSHTLLDWMDIQCNSFQPEKSLWFSNLDYGQRYMGNGEKYEPTLGFKKQITHPSLSAFNRRK